MTSVSRNRVRTQQRTAAGGSSYRRSEVVAALSHALDLTEGQPIGHAGRTCLVGLAVAARMGLPADDVGALYYALLLKDAGCSSSAARMSEIFGGADDLELKRAGKVVDFARPGQALRFVREHAGSTSSGIRRTREIVAAALEFARHGGEIVAARCERGARIVDRMGFPSQSAAAVRALDERWDGRGRPDGLSGDQIPLLARIASLAQNVDFFLTAGGRESSRAMVRERRGRWFDPDVADAFLLIGDGDELWGSLDGADRPETTAAHEPPAAAGGLAEADLDNLALAFADVIDAKSPFTANHSRGVARAAVAIGRTLGCGDSELRSLHRSALLQTSASSACRTRYSTSRAD